MDLASIVIQRYRSDTISLQLNEQMNGRTINFREPHWISMGLPEISRVTLTGMQLSKNLKIVLSAIYKHFIYLFCWSGYAELRAAMKIASVTMHRFNERFRGMEDYDGIMNRSCTCDGFVFCGCYGYLESATFNETDLLWTRTISDPY